MSITDTTTDIITIADERPTTEAERVKCTTRNPLVSMCNGSDGSHWCVAPADHDGVHIATRNNYTEHIASWGTAAQWGLPVEMPTSTEMPTEDATLAFIRAKLSEPVAVTIADFSHYTADESREQYNYARRQLLDLADKYRQYEDTTTKEHAELVIQRDQYINLANEHQSDFKTFANMLLAEAERRGWCSDYEKFADDVNRVMKRNEVPHRMKEYRVTNTYTVTVSVTVMARDEDGAIEEAQTFSEPHFSATGAWNLIDTTDDSEWEAEIND